MPEKSFAVATYAAGASLAAITLIYVFAPTYFLDSDPSSQIGPLSSISARKKGAVGLTNAANDCFINSVLQALAGLGDLRLYLIRETHRRNIDEAWVYAQAVPDDDEDTATATNPLPSPPRRRLPAWKVEGLQRGIVTKGLKDILDQLNERPIYKKTITAVPFVKVLEAAFRQRISRQQQDAQEFLQVVAERLCDEYHAGQRARKYAKRKNRPAIGDVLAIEHGAATVELGDLPQGSLIEAEEPNGEENLGDEEGFPMEGRIESQIECLTCGFKPRPAEQVFCTLTLNVPQVSSTTLNLCFDGMFKTEYIEEFRCEKCRLAHAKSEFEAKATAAPSETAKSAALCAVGQLQAAIDTDPEKPPPDVELPDVRNAPQRKIARHVRLTRFPKILAIHLSRSIYDPSQMSLKNSARVSFPERLPLGGLLQQRKYKLLGLVTHKGSHHSGHYESFRRHNIYPPFSNPSTFHPSGIYSRSGSPAATPRIGAVQQPSRDNSPLASTPDLLSSTGRPNGSTSSLTYTVTPGLETLEIEAPGEAASGLPSMLGQSPPLLDAKGEDDAEASSLRSMARSTLSRIVPSSRSDNGVGSRISTPAEGKTLPLTDRAADEGRGDDRGPKHTSPKIKRKKQQDRWWRISDDKIKEASTREVLGMQREVYLLFYELERVS